MQGNVESGAQKIPTSSNEEHTYYVLLRGSATVGNTLTANVFNECGQSPEKEAAYAGSKKLTGHGRILPERRVLASEYRRVCLAAKSEL